MNYTKYMWVGIVALMVVVAGPAAWTYAAPFTLLSANQDLSFGSTGKGVEELQGILSELGYLHVPVTVPFGYFGPLTQRALAEYQADLMVPPTGYFGQMTRDRMTSSFAAHGWLALLASIR